MSLYAAADLTSSKAAETYLLVLWNVDPFPAADFTTLKGTLTRDF